MTTGRFAATLALVAAVAAVPATAAADGIRCKSQDYRYNFCSVSGPIRSVYVRRQKSDRPCIEGRSWGWQRNGIWVNHGCEADFEVTYRYEGGGGGWNGGGGWGDGGSWGGGGGGWGNGGGGWNDGGGQPAPPWVVGSWQTEVPVNGMYRSLTLWPNGRASYTGGGGTRGGYWYNGDIQLADGTRLRVVRESRGELVVLHPTHGRMLMWRVN